MAVYLAVSELHLLSCLPSSLSPPIPEILPQHDVDPLWGLLVLFGSIKNQNQVSDSILATGETSWVLRSTERVGFEPTVPVKTRWFSRPEP